MTKLDGILANVEPDSRVAVVTMLGSLCPVTLGHVQAFVDARRLLLGEAGVVRPARLEPFSAVVGLISLNSDRYVGSKLDEKGLASLSYEQRLGLVQMAVQEHPWLGWEDYEGEMLAELQRSHPHLVFEHFYMNGADDVLRHAKYEWAGPRTRMITMGRPGDTEEVVRAALRAGVDLDAGCFIMGPELPDISSSEARKALARGDLTAAARCLHPSVLAWCHEAGVWRDAAAATPPQEGGSAAQRAQANLARFDALPRQEPPPPASAHDQLLQLYLHAQAAAHGKALREMQGGRKISHWIWWEWPAYTPVRVTSQHEYDLPSCAACAAWLADETLGPRWAQMTIAAAEHLESGVPAPRLFGSGTDVAKFHENATLVSLCAPRPEQRKLAARALRALKQPRHPGVVRAVEAERGRAAVVDGDPGRA